MAMLQKGTPSYVFWFITQSIYRRYIPDKSLQTLVHPSEKGPLPVDSSVFLGPKNTPGKISTFLWVGKLGFCENMWLLWWLDNGDNVGRYREMYMRVSIDGGTPKWLVCKGKSH